MRAGLVTETIVFMKLEAFRVGGRKEAELILLTIH